MAFFKWKTYKEYRDFGMLLGVIFSSIALWPLKNQLEPYWPLLGFAGLLLALTFVWPKGLFPFYKVWMWIGEVLGWVNSHIILGFIFYVLITPISLIMKILGKDPIPKKADPHKISYWIKKEKTDHQESMKNQF